jgi:hypothetical protein
MKTPAAVRAVLSGTALMLFAAAPALRADDSPEEIAREMAEKMAKCLERADKAQKKAAEKAAKRAREAQKDLTEEQEEAAEKALKEQRKEARRRAEAAKDAAKYEEEALEEFDDNVEHYVKLHKKALKTVTVPAPGPKATPEEILAHQRALAVAIRALRPAARPGDVFLPESHAAFKRIIAEELQGRVGASARSAIREGNPPVEIDRDDRMAVRLAVNAAYPEAAPVSTVPASVLLSLPLIPADYVEYRFVNRDLVLRDVGANMIVDYIHLATPPLTTPAPAATRR